MESDSDDEIARRTHEASEASAEVGVALVVRRLGLTAQVGGALEAEGRFGVSAEMDLICRGVGVAAAPAVRSLGVIGG